MCRKITFCQKHNIERSIKKRSNRNDEYYCNLCKNEKAVERRYFINSNNTEWVAKQNYFNNLTEEDKRVLKLEQLKKANDKFKLSEKKINYNIVNRKCKHSNIYCFKCKEYRVYGTKFCKDCKLLLNWVRAKNFISKCINCLNTFDLDTKLLNKGKFEKINTFCSLECQKNNKHYCIKHNCKYTKRGKSNKYYCIKCIAEKTKIMNANPEQRAKKREYDKINKTKKRLENPLALKQAQEKYYKTEKGKALLQYYNLLRNVNNCSNLYCIECNDVRLYGDKICDKCKVGKRYISLYDYISICRHCNEEFGIETKLKNLGNIPQLNKYCSIECNKQSKKITKKKNAKIHRCKYKRIKEDKQLAKKYGNKYEPISRTIVYRKHNYICTSCGVKCLHPNKENYNQSNAATLDHIIPKSKGGSHTYNNVTLLCRSCNTNKSDKILTDYKRNQSQLELKFIDYIPQGTQLQLQMT